MRQFTKIPKSTFDELQLDAGILLNKFNPANPNVQDADIVCATTGGINPSCVATYSDFFEDVDNAPNNVKEGKHLDGWDCKIATTCLGTSPKLIRMALGAADIDSDDETKIVPRMSLDVKKDFNDVWWVGDKANGGYVAVRLMNALSTGGFSLQTTKNGKGTVGLELTGHVSIEAQDVVPMEFYSVDPVEPVTPSVTLNKDAVSLAPEATETLTATVIPSDATVTWTTSNGEVATVSNAGLVTAVAEGTATITATITVDGTNYTATCAVTVSAGV